MTAPRPRWPDALADRRAMLDTMFRATPFYELLGIELVDWGPGWAQLRMDTEPRHGNLAGSVHGGVTFALADAAFEVACNAYGRLAVALETACHYLSAAPLGTGLSAEATEISRSARTASYRLEVRDEADGQLRATYLALAYRTSRWHVDADGIPEGW